jgi:hypothetical protein
MKKITVFFALIFSLTLISGCTSKPSESSDSSSAKETVASSEKIGEKALSKKQVSFEKGQSLFDVLKETYAVEDDNGMITSIDGHAQDEKNNKYWVFTINDEQVNSGAKDVTLKKDDRVVFKLEQF